MAVERELRRLLQYARLPQDEREADKNVGSEPSNQNERSAPTSRVAAKTIFDRLQLVCQQQVLPSTNFSIDFNVPELLVLVAEAAVYQKDFEVARACVAWFLSESTKKDQFYCRIQLVQAHCASAEAAEDIGATKLRKVLNAVHFILLVLPVATDQKRRPHYDFLVYNSSVTYWQVARQLMKRSTFQYLLPSLNTIIDAMKTVEEKDILWLFRLQITLVHAQIDAKHFALAAKTVCDIVDVQFAPILSDPSRANDTAVKTLYEEALRLQIHVGSFKDPECQKILANMKKGGTSKRNSLLTKLQTIKSGAFTGTLDAALTELFQETTGMNAFATATTSDEEIIAHLRGLNATSSQSVDAEILVEAGIIAAFRQEYRHAVCCDIVLQAKGKSVDPKFRVLHQVLKAILLALVPPPPTANYKLTCRQRAALVVTRRLEGVRAIERALLACKRQQDPALIENVCLYAWNLSLPLLQPNCRDQLSRLFSLASSSLEELHSLQLNLRVRLMLELSKVELSAEFISKAQDNVNKALGLDYGTISASASTAPTLEEISANQSKWLRRPLDVHLLPLRKRLDAKLTVDDPTTHEEELTVAVEQLRDAQTPEQKNRQLQRVVTIIQTMFQRRESGNYVELTPSVDVLLHLNAASAFAWHELKDAAVATKLTRVALGVFFPGATGDSPTQNQQAQLGSNGDAESTFSDKSVMLLEVDLRLRLVELIAHELKARAHRFELALAEKEASKSGKKKSRGISRESQKQTQQMEAEQAADMTALLLLSKESHVLGLAALDTGAAVVEEAVDESILNRKTAFESDLQSLKTELIQELGAALRVSTRIGWTFVIENSAVFLWNYHFHVFRTLLSSPTAPPILAECIATFEAALGTLESLPSSLVNLDLLMSVALGLAMVHERSGKLDKATAIADSILKRQRASAAILSSPQAGASSIPLVLLGQFAALKVRIQIQQNAKEIAPVDITPQVKVASLLSAMEVMFHQHAVGTSLPPTQQAQCFEKATSFFQKATAAWEPIAGESLERVKDENLTLEEQQQQLEVYCEIWVRLGCASFRSQNPKLAMDYGRRALKPVTNLLSESEQCVWITDTTWRWLAIAELLCARAILALLSGETAAWALIEATLTHSVRATDYASRAGAPTILLQAAKVAWNAVLTVMAAVDNERALGESSDESSEARSWSRLLPQLCEVLKALSKGARGGMLGQFGLLVLDVCEKANDWKAAIGVASSLIQGGPALLSADQLKDVSTVHAIAVASLGEGDSSSGSGASAGKGKEHNVLMQAKIMRKIAFSSWRHPPAQLKALAAAHKELEAYPEEQALVLIEIAEWFFTHQFPTQEVNAHLDAAMRILVRGQRQINSSNSKPDSANSSRGTNADSETPEYAPLWYADKLVRVFTTRAICASSMHERWVAVRSAIHQVYVAWDCIVDIANETDLRDQFRREAQPDKSVDFNEWKIEKPTKFPRKSPHNLNEWVAFYQQYAASLTSRFFMPWVAALTGESITDRDRRSITNPILTASILEQLMALLSSFYAHEQMLPVMCLSQVVYFALCPHKCKTMEIYLELTTYDVLEKMNLAELSVPLQSALELLQSSGDDLLKELQQEKAVTSVEVDGLSARSRRRGLLQLSAVNVGDKIAQCVDLLLRFGFIRQAKVLSIMLHNVANRTPTSTSIKRSCGMMALRIQDLEGNDQAVLQSSQRLLHSPSSQLDLDFFIQLIMMASEKTVDKHKAIEELLVGERLAATAILSGGECAQLHQPLHGQAVAKYLTSLAAGSSTSTRVGTTTKNILSVDLDALCRLAQLKAHRAGLLLEISTNNATLEHAQRVFQEAAELAISVDANTQLAQLKLAFGDRLVTYAIKTRRSSLNPSEKHTERWLLDARVLLQEALALLQDMRLETFEPTTAAVRSSSFSTPLDVMIAELKIRLAALELQLEESPAVVTDQQMTWYTYERETNHNIVEKWLDQTAVRAPIERPGNLSRAFALATSAATILSNNLDALESRAVAVVTRRRCERLALYHNAVKSIRDSVQRFLWTRFTSPNALHETWICAASSSRGAATEEGGRGTPAFPSNNSAADTEVNLELRHQFAKLADELEMELKTAIDKRHVETIRLCTYELVQVYGCNQPLACAKALLQYQSTVVREDHMKPLVQQCLASTNVTRLHMKRSAQLTCYHTNAPQNSLPFQLSQLFLDQQSDIYKRMNVSVSMDAALAVLPTTKRILCIQFSPDRCFLYAALVSAADKCAAMARMECTSNKLRDLATLRERVQAWRKGMAKALLALEDSNNQELPHDTHDFVQTSGEETSFDTEDDVIETEFNAIVAATNEFFRPLFDHSVLASALESELANNSLVLIVDRELELLPLEAVRVFGKADAITREFSIHLLYHRLVALKTHPFRKDDVRVIVDPCDDDAGLNDQTLTTTVHQFTKKAGAVFANWKDAVEHGQVPTTTDWQQAMLLRKSGALVYAGPHRGIGSFVSLQTLAGMNLASACYALVLLDRAENQSSARRQSKLDSAKAKWELDLEDDPYACALLCSLCGVNTIVLNQWATSFHANRRLTSGVLSGLAKGQSLVRAVRKYPETVAPIVATPPNQPARKASTTASPAVASSLPGKYRLKNRIRFSTAVFGVGHLTFKVSD